jgi:hypothetical protein
MGFLSLKGNAVTIFGGSKAFGFLGWPWLSQEQQGAMKLGKAPVLKRPETGALN